MRLQKERRDCARNHDVELVGFHMFTWSITIINPLWKPAFKRGIILIFHQHVQSDFPTINGIDAWFDDFSFFNGREMVVNSLVPKSSIYRGDSHHFPMIFPLFIGDSCRFPDISMVSVRRELTLGNVIRKLTSVDRDARTFQLGSSRLEIRCQRWEFYGNMVI